MVEEARQKTNQKNRSGTPFIITPGQGLCLSASTLMGVGVLVLPRTSTKGADQYGWIAVLIAMLIAVFAVIMINSLSARFPEKTLVEMCRELLGSKKNRWVGKILAVPVVLSYTTYWLLFTAFVARMFGEVVVTAVLVKTPIEVIIGTMLFLCLFLSYYDSEVVARVNQVLLFIIVVPVLFISLSAYQGAKMENLMPILPRTQLTGILIATIPVLESFVGMEVMLMFNRNVKHSKVMHRFQIYGVLLPGIIYLLIVIAGTMSFGYEELALQTWPTLELVKSINVPGLILERLEAVFLSVWVAAVFTTCGNWYYCAIWSFRQLFGIRKKRWLPLVFYVGCYLIAIKMAQNIFDLFWYFEKIGYLGLLISVVFPSLLLMLAMIRKIDGRKLQSVAEGEATHEAS